jgi:hypothetical protein
MPSTSENLERAFYRALNEFVEPWVRAGAGSPGLMPAGLIVLETSGRVSGVPRRTPLAGSVVEGHIIVGTVRGARSQWARNAAANASVRYWLMGRERTGVATVLAGWCPKPALDGLPPLVRALAEGPLAAAVRTGWTFAIVAPMAGGDDAP